MRERDIGAGERERMGEEGEEERHEREMCVRASVQERLSCTINQRFLSQLSVKWRAVQKRIK